MAFVEVEAVLVFSEVSCCFRDVAAVAEDLAFFEFFGAALESPFPDDFADWLFSGRCAIGDDVVEFQKF